MIFRANILLWRGGLDKSKNVIYVGGAEKVRRTHDYTD